MNKDTYNARERRVLDSNGINAHAQLQIVRHWGSEVVRGVSSIPAECQGKRRDPEHLDMRGLEQRGSE